jgi:hypothetical protein
LGKADDNVTIQITSVFDLDGLKVLGAFSDERSLLNWSKEMCIYTALRSQAALDICKEQNIDRVAGKSLLTLRTLKKGIHLGYK